MAEIIRAHSKGWPDMGKLIDALADHFAVPVCPNCGATDWEDNYCVCGAYRAQFDRANFVRVAKGE